MDRWYPGLLAVLTGTVVKLWISTGRFSTLVLACALLAGCASSGRSGAIWWNPLTWGSHSEASSADRALRRADEAAKAEDSARDALLKKAQEEAHKTELS